MCREIATIVDCSKIAAFTECKTFFKSRIVKILLRVGRPDQSIKIFEGHMILLVLEPLMQLISIFYKI